MDNEGKKDKNKTDKLNGHLINPDKTDNLLGGIELRGSTTSAISTPERLIDQVIGQERARKIIEKAAKQHRHVMMIGSPGTGKSMLAKSMTEIMNEEELKDVLMYPNEDDKNNPKVRTTPAGHGKKIVEAHEQEAEEYSRMKTIIMWSMIAGVLLYTLLSGTNLILGIVGSLIIYFIFSYITTDLEDSGPNLLIDNSERDVAPFEDATGAHSGSLLGDVRHDPYQSGGMETPPHQRVEAGSIQRSNDGVLFIDEINTLDVRSQQKLMTAIQEGSFSITGQSERSSGAMVQTEDVPTNFIMVAAGNMDAIENMHPALRDRIEGYGYEVYMEDTAEDTPENRRKFVQFVAQEVERDGEIPHFSEDAVREIVREARRNAGRKGELTLKLRNLGGLVRNAGDIAKAEESNVVEMEHVIEAKSLTKSIEQQYADEITERKKEYSPSSSTDSAVGRVNGLAVMGDDSGILLPVMSKVADSQQKGRGKIISTGKLQDIAEEAVDNVSAVIKDISDANIEDKDIHIQFVQTYEGVQGDSASVTVATAIVSAMENIPVKQNIAMTGSLSVRGDVLPVGGVTHKIEAAAKSGMDKVIIPKSNKEDVMLEEKYQDMIEIETVEHINEVVNIALEKDKDGDTQSLIERMTSLTNAPELGNPTS